MGIKYACGELRGQYDLGEFIKTWFPHNLILA